MYIKCYKTSYGKCTEEPIRLREPINGLAEVLINQGLHLKIQKRIEKFHKDQYDYFCRLNPDYENGTEVQYINCIKVHQDDIGLEKETNRSASENPSVMRQQNYMW